jgi:hypothetical protein
VAQCDVIDLRTRKRCRSFPSKTLWDWRRCLVLKTWWRGLCTADLHHAFIAKGALNRDMHVFARSRSESRKKVSTVRAILSQAKAETSTLHGKQRHAYPNFVRLRELILDGAIGELKTVHSWDARQLPRPV